jgi:hypothetical protein
VDSVDETADQLVRRCVAAMGEGADFPILWDTVLRRHSLVVGPPIQGIERGRAWLRIPLVTNQWLVFESASETFSLLRR